jgi:hypothetical protein
VLICSTIKAIDDRQRDIGQASAFSGSPAIEMMIRPIRIMPAPVAHFWTNSPGIEQPFRAPTGIAPRATSTTSAAIDWPTDHLDNHENAIASDEEESNTIAWKDCCRFAARTGRNRQQAIQGIDEDASEMDPNPSCANMLLKSATGRMPT